MFRNVFKIDIFSPSSHLLLNQCLSGIDLFTANRLAKSPSNTPDTRMFTIREGTAIPFSHFWISATCGENKSKLSCIPPGNY